MEDLKKQDVEVEQDDLDIEVYDDRPEQDQRDPVDLDELDENDDEELTDEEIAALGKRTQKRIKSLTFKYNEARRQKEELERIAQQAVEDARRTRALAEKASSATVQYQQALLKQRSESSTASVAQAEAALAAAYEEGDPQAIAKAQSLLTDTKIAARQAAQAESYYQSRMSAPRAESGEDRASQPQIQTPKPSSAAQEWAGRNPWFGKDEEMTSLAYGIHERWVRSGKIPDTPEYYAALDQRMRELLPARFSDNGSAPSGQAAPTSASRTSPVAPASRSSSSSGGSGKVRLSRSEVKFAERMGIPLKRYAEEKLKFERQQKENA